MDKILGVYIIRYGRGGEVSKGNWKRVISYVERKDEEKRVKGVKVG